MRGTDSGGINDIQVFKYIRPYVLFFWFALPLVLFSLSNIFSWHWGFNWHDQQRVCQLILLCVSSFLIISQSKPSLPPLAFLLLTVILLIGLLSVMLAKWPLWALKEWARYAGLSLLSLFIGSRNKNTKYSVLVLGLIAIVGIVQAFQFLVYYSAAFISGLKILKSDLLFSGFANPRFFGQFQILLMPVLSGLILTFRPTKPAVSLLLASVLACQWSIGLALGGRGLWAGLAVSHAALVIIAPRYWRHVVVQSAAGLMGALLFILLLHVIPTLLELTPSLRENLRAGMSGREKLWLLAWEMVRAHPWLGVGPLHFSAVFNPIAAHPHQVALQWAAEWGVPVTLMALALGVWGMVSSIFKIRQREQDDIGAAIWLAIAGALVLAQVDGVFVMPYVETWLAALIGLALARWRTSSDGLPVERALYLLLAVSVLAVLGQTLITEAPVLAQRSEEYLDTHNLSWMPRFWAQGWIPMESAGE